MLYEVLQLMIASLHERLMLTGFFFLVRAFEQPADDLGRQLAAERILH